MSAAPAPEPTRPAALEIDDLWVNYGSVPAVRQLRLTVGRFTTEAEIDEAADLLIRAAGTTA